jgi:hypothetical protein
MKREPRYYLYVGNELQGLFNTFLQAQRVANRLPRGTHYTVQEDSNVIYIGRAYGPRRRKPVA